MRRAGPDFNAESDFASVGALFALVLWITCATVSVVGFIIPYARPQAPPPPPPPVQAEILDVRLTTHEVPVISPEPTRPSEPFAAPPPLEFTPPKTAPPLIAVAEATPAVAFPLPIEGPVRIVPAQEAAYVRPPAEVAAPANPAPITSALPQQITFGQGEGIQPAPEYPRRALTAGQEGTVVVRFTVGESGRVIAAEAWTTSPWPLLNEAAVRVVRDRWRFGSGTTRLYEVAIHFQLQK